MPEMEVSDVDETLKYTFAKTLVYGKNNIAVNTVCKVTVISVYFVIKQLERLLAGAVPVLGLLLLISG